MISSSRIISIHRICLKESEFDFTEPEIDSFRLMAGDVDLFALLDWLECSFIIWTSLTKTQQNGLVRNFMRKGRP